MSAEIRGHYDPVPAPDTSGDFIRAVRRAGMKYSRGLVIAIVLLAIAPASLAFDHAHAAWDALLKRHVVMAPNGNASRVDYGGLSAELGTDQRPLNGYLDMVSVVTMAEYRGWTRDEQLAFLLNAYNAYTVELVLTRYPALQSIKDLGSFVRSVWKKEFFDLLGARRSLDAIEQDMIRAPGAFDEPRIHFALNCASIGCPLLRNEAYVAARLDAQLEDAARRFLGDRSRNRYDPASHRLEVSLIFDWYRADFEKAGRRMGSVPQFLARYADLLADDAAGRATVRQTKAPLRYLDYDWNLNDVKRETKRDVKQ